MGVPLNPNPQLNVGPAAAAAEAQPNPPRGFDVVWSLNHADDVGACLRRVFMLAEAISDQSRYP